MFHLAEASFMPCFALAFLSAVKKEPIPPFA